jgi:uncharacterized repeat protein (TIGR03803 family)
MKTQPANFARTIQAWKTICTVLLLCAAMTVPASAQTYSVVTDAVSDAFLTLGLDGNFYTAVYGGETPGLIYRITPSGTVTTVYSFPGYPHESDPAPRLLLGTDGNFYGTTLVPFGSIFKVTPDGAFTTLYTFTCSNIDCGGGYWADFGLVEGRDGNFYGTAALAGANNWGMMFRVTPGGTFTVVYNFCASANCTDGGRPGQLIQASDGNFYGATNYGGSENGGTIFKITPDGALTVLHNLHLGLYVEWGLIQGSDGNFYGATYGGGANGKGSVFKMTPTGDTSTLYSFCSQANCTDGGHPYAGLVEGSDGNFYGTTLVGGNSPQHGGTIFSVTPAGAQTTLYRFCAAGFPCSDGDSPESTMIQATNGDFYGTNVQGGTGGGVVYSLSVGRDPLVEMLPTSSQVGQSVKILGQGLSGTTAVSFNGISAGFTINSDTYITASVPAGTTTGYVTVETAGGTLRSNLPFQIRP